MAIDPICGMEVDEKKAKFMLVKDGKENYFCSKNCYNKFLDKEMPKSKKPAEKEPIPKKPAINKKIITERESIIKKENRELSKESEIKKIIIPIKGMHCASCAATVEKKAQCMPFMGIIIFFISDS